MLNRSRNRGQREPYETGNNFRIRHFLRRWEATSVTMHWVTYRVAQLSNLSIESASNRDLIVLKWEKTCIHFSRFDTAFVFQGADFSHRPVLRTKLSESSPQPQANQENACL